MDKKGQITMFIIMGLVIVFAFGFLIYVRNIGVGTTPAIDVRSVALSGQKASLESKINFCIEQKTKEAIDLFGLKQSSEKLIKDYVESKLIECIDFGLFESQELTIQRSSGFASVDITEKAVLVDVYFPITIIKGDVQEELSRYNFYLPRIQQASLSFDSDNALKNDVTIVTKDGDAELFIPKGALVTKDGQPFSRIEFKIVDRNFDGLSNGVVIGSTAYKGTDGVQFDPWAMLKINYEKQDIPPGVSEKDLVLMWYDKERDLWKAVPTRVDTENNQVVASISHFTPVAIGGDVCKLAGFNKQVIYSGIIFKEECRDCKSATAGSIYFTDSGIVSLPDSEGEHFGDGCVGPKDWDKDDAGDDCDCPEHLIEDISLPEGYADGDGIKKGSCVYTPKIPDDPDTLENEREDESCTYELATPPTYGYNSMGDVGGKGDFFFTVFPKGDGCVAVDDEGGVSVDVDVISPSGDSASWTLNGISGSSAAIRGSEPNELHAEVSNSNDACAEVVAVITFTGFGALPDCEKGAWIEKNCHCGYTNVDITPEQDEPEKKLFCCDKGAYPGVVVEDQEDCKATAENQCLESGQEGIVSKDMIGCFCGEEQYVGSDEHNYCCSDGLSSEPCQELCSFDFPDDVLEEFNIPPTGHAIRDITGAGTTDTRLYEGSCGDPIENFQIVKIIVGLCTQTTAPVDLDNLCEFINAQKIIEMIASETAFADWCNKNRQICNWFMGSANTYVRNNPSISSPQFNCPWTCCKRISEPCSGNCMCAGGEMPLTYICPNENEFCCVGGCDTAMTGTCSEHGGECCEEGYTCELGHFVRSGETCGGFDCCEQGFCKTELPSVNSETCGAKSHVCCEYGCAEGAVSYDFICVDKESGRDCCDKCKGLIDVLIERFINWISSIFG